MKNEIEIKNLVKDRYGKIALNNISSCGCCSSVPEEQVYTIMQDKYDNKAGYMPDADLGLGCGIPTDFANIKQGEIVLDLGSGAGNDVFIARSFTGESGKVIGLDMTQEMINKANENLSRTGFKNIEFILGEIENIPLESNYIDIIISNCVLNLVPDKVKAFAELYRVLKPGGRFCISDVVMVGTLPEKLQEAAKLYVGCVAGALQMDAYLNIIKIQGFKNVSVNKQKVIDIPTLILSEYLSDDEIAEFIKSKSRIYSITVSAEKPV
jgi:arsenite methyltransferase